MKLFFFIILFNLSRSRLIFEKGDDTGSSLSINQIHFLIVYFSIEASIDYEMFNLLLFFVLLI
jgi:hypothetical protein